MKMLDFRAKEKGLIRGKMLQECKCISKCFNDEVDFFNSPQRARLLSFYPALIFLDLVATYLRNIALAKNLLSLAENQHFQLPRVYN